MPWVNVLNYYMFDVFFQNKYVLFVYDAWILFADSVIDNYFFCSISFVLVASWWNGKSKKQLLRYLTIVIIGSYVIDSIINL